MLFSRSRRRTGPGLLAAAAAAALLFFQKVAAQSTSSSASGILLDEIDTVFAFGDSYTYDGYFPENGINNFPGIGNTSTGGFNWIQYLTTPSSIYDSSSSSFSGNHSITLYDLAFSGATVNGSIVEGSEGTPDFVAQVEMWEEYFEQGTGTALGEAPWVSNTTLFVLWFGINDVGFSYLQNLPFPSLLPSMFDTYNRLVARLYAGGARNFLILGVPPTQRTPLVQSYGDAAVAEFAGHVASYNAALTTLSTSLLSLYPDTQLALFDTQPFFSAVLDSPRTYGFLESEVYCPAYADVMDDPMVELAECAWPMREYVWWNAYHPTWTVHRLLAIVIANTLSPSLPITTTSLLPPSPSISSNASLTGTATASELTTITTLLPSTFIPTTSLTNTVPASAPTTTQTRTVSATGTDGMGVGGGEGGGNGASGKRSGAGEKVVAVAVAGLVVALGAAVGW
ncbi:hypothetical protein JCM6882_004310 [Rhodosporidiobolus microsporus]